MWECGNLRIVGGGCVFVFLVVCVFGGFIKFMIGELFFVEVVVFFLDLVGFLVILKDDLLLLLILIGLKF